MGWNFFLLKKRSLLDLRLSLLFSFLSIKVHRKSLMKVSFRVIVWLLVVAVLKSPKGMSHFKK